MKPAAVWLLRVLTSAQHIRVRRAQLVPGQWVEVHVHHFSITETWERGYLSTYFVMVSLQDLNILGHGAKEVEKMALLDLPNEILIHILYCFTTLPLLNMRSVNHRFQNLIIRIVHSRLLLAASLEDRKLILEFYHPSAQYTEPYVFCDYLGTPGLSDCVPGQGSIYEAQNGEGLLRNLYSRFRPTRRWPDPVLPKVQRPHPAGDIPGTRTSDIANSSDRQSDTEAVKRIVSLDAHENFSQLVFSTDLVQLGPHRGLFTDIVNVNDKKTLRIFREWAARQAADPQELQDMNGDVNSSSVGKTRDSGITWIDDTKKTAGLRLKVEERKWRRDIPLLLHKDEDQAVSYSMELRELHVSTVHLLLSIEYNILQKQENDSGKAMVFGTFARTL